MVIEILIAGLMAFLWISISMYALFVDGNVLKESLSNISNNYIKEYKAFIMPSCATFILVVSYHLGWIINGITYKIASLTYREKLYKEIFGEKFNGEKL